MASYTKTFNNDLTSFVAGKIWDEIKERVDDKTVKADPMVKAAVREVRQEDPSANIVVDKNLRNTIANLFGVDLHIQLLKTEGKVEKMADKVTAIAGGISDTHRLLINQNEIIESRFDDILAILTKRNELDKEKAEQDRVDKEADELKEKRLASSASAIAKMMGAPASFGRWLSALFTKAAGDAIGKGLIKPLKRMIFRRLTFGQKKNLVRLGRYTPNALKKRATKAIAGKLLGKTATKKLVAKGGGKYATKATAGKIPVWSLVVAAGFAADKFRVGDWGGGILEILSGVAAVIPKAGTAVSYAIDALIFARDMDRAGKGLRFESGTKGFKGGLATLDGVEWAGKSSDVMNPYIKSLTGASAGILAALTGYTAAAGITEADQFIKNSGLAIPNEKLTYKTDIGGSIRQVDTTSFVSNDKIVDDKLEKKFIKDLNRKFNKIEVEESDSNNQEQNETTGSTDTTQSTTIASLDVGNPSKFASDYDFGEMRSTGKHLGEDYSVAQGTPVTVTRDGVVDTSYYSKGGGNAGGTFVVNFGDEALRFAHMSKIYVQPGQKVKAGETIALTGGSVDFPFTSGRSTGPHLHLEYYATPTAGPTDPNPHADKFFRFGSGVSANEETAQHQNLEPITTDISSVTEAPEDKKSQKVNLDSSIVADSRRESLSSKGSIVLINNITRAQPNLIVRQDGSVSGIDMAMLHSNVLAG